MNKRWVLAAVALAALAFGNAGPAEATDVSMSELAALADAAASGDAGARTELERVTSVDGQPIDAAELLDGDPDDVVRRLRTIAALDAPAPGIDAAAARSDAAAILASPEYRRAEPTPPGWLQRFSEWLAGLIPDEIGEILANPVLWLFAALIGAATILYLVARNVARRRRDRAGVDARAVEPIRRTAAALEQEARRAATAGDYNAAVRLWFEAGAIRLADRGVVAQESTSTSGTIRRAVPTSTMAALTTTFDLVAYGNRRATAADATAAERGWTRVVSDLSSRD